MNESLLIGNLQDAQAPPPFVTGLLFVAGEHDVTPRSGLAFERVPLKEFGEASAQDVKRAVDWLERTVPNNKVMVCCRAGMGRSVSMVIAYLCCVKGMSYTDAVKLMSARRPGATPLPKLESTIIQVQQLRQATEQAAPSYRSSSLGRF